MLKQLFSRLFDNIVYIQIWGNRLKVVDVKSGNEFDQPPFIALEKNKKGQFVVKAVGAEAKALINNPQYEVTNPFAHPRQLIANFGYAEKILLHALQQVFKGNIFAPSPRAVIHPMQKTEGGLTEIEIRAFRELGLGAGAREVVIYLGPAQNKHDFNYAEIKARGL
ncbi:MAG: rod shape-determining protein [Marinagarivorans sp.]|nr:rod shape-determining protein [Marinagarivorans sp.]